MKKFILLLAIVLLAGCSNKIIPDNSHAMNPIKAVPGLTITTVRWDGLEFGKTVDDYKAMIEKQFPNCIGIYVDSNYSSIFYVFIQNKE